MVKSGTKKNKLSNRILPVVGFAICPDEVNFYQIRLPANYSYTLVSMAK